MSCHCAPETKQSVVYMVLCDYRDGLAWAERAAERTGKLATAADIRSGELPRVRQVIEIEFGVTHGLRGTMNSRDVTEDFVVDGQPVCPRDLKRDGIHGW
jgi:hypothetical protein